MGMSSLASEDLQADGVFEDEMISAATSAQVSSKYGSQRQRSINNKKRGARKVVTAKEDHLREDKEL